VNQTVAAWEPAAGRRRWLFPALLLGGSVATAAAAIAGNGNVVVATLPVAAAALLVTVWFVPIRISLLGLVFLGLALDGDGPLDSPVAPLGNLLNLTNLNKFVPIPALAVPAMTLALGYVLVVHLYRRLSLSRIDEVGRVGFASPMPVAMAVSVLTVVAEIANGYRTGGDLQMAKIQVQDFLLLLLVAYLFASTLRGLRDYRVLGIVILAAACSKALMALWVFSAVYPRPAVATSHGDSLLFACATIMLIARFAEQPVRRNAMLCLTFLPLLVGAMIANNRRLVWVQVAATLGTLYFISRRTPLKRLVTRSVLLALPLVVAYVAVGWNSNATLFAPVRVFRSVGDADVDASTLFRDLENYNLLVTLRANPIIGTGFGQQFNEQVTTPDISFFKEYRYLPHNSVLGLWCFTGLLGFTGLFMGPVVGVLFAARSYHWSRVPDQRAAAFTALGMVLTYLIHCYGDIGFSERESIFLVGPALAVSGQLAFSTGAWGARPPAPAGMSGRR
jgi:O-antigen ligase